jgi:hypothetical protein
MQRCLTVNLGRWNNPKIVDEKKSPYQANFFIHELAIDGGSSV